MPALTGEFIESLVVFPAFTSGWACSKIVAVLGGNMELNDEKKDELTDTEGLSESDESEHMPGIGDSITAIEPEEDTGEDDVRRPVLVNILITLWIIGVNATFYYFLIAHRAVRYTLEG